MVSVVKMDHKGRCSPGRMSGSTTVFCGIARRLQQLNYRIGICTRGSFIRRNIGKSVVFSVTHSGMAVTHLESLRSRNTLIVGSTCNVSGYIHGPVARLLVGGKIPRPRDFVVSATSRCLRGYCPY